MNSKSKFKYGIETTIQREPDAPTWTRGSRSAQHHASPWKDTCALALIARCVHRAKHPGIFNFLGSVLFEPEIREQFAHRLGTVAGIRHYRGECLDKAAQRMRYSIAALGTSGAEVVYGAALMVCVQHQFERAYGIVRATDILRSITCGALHRLDDTDPTAASHLRALLGWGNEDELDHSIVHGFKIRVLALYEQETTIQIMRLQPADLYAGAEPHGTRKFLQ